jgi:hypothetical protein
MASQVAVNHPPQGNCRFESCLWCNERFAHAVAKWNGRSPPKAAFAGSNPAGGTNVWSGPVRIWEARRLSTAQGEFDSRPDRSIRQGIPISRGRRPRPGVLQVQVLSLVPTGA